MALDTVTLTNSGDPLYLPDGTLLSSTEISFTLVSARGRIKDAWDATTHERVGGTTTVTTDENGEFTVSLWPNSRGNLPTYYLCEVDSTYFVSFIAGITDSDSALQWVDFYLSGTPITTVETTAFAAHAADSTIHFTTSGLEYTSLNVGDEAGGNYTEIGTDGTQRLKGDATAWKDMVSDLFGKRLLSTSGKVGYDYDENAIVFSSGGDINTANDRVGGNQQIDHEFKVGSVTFKPHVHWFQDVAAGAVTAFVLTMRYRLQRNNAAKTSAWTTVTLTSGIDDIFDFTGEADGTYNQISTFSDISVICGVSDTIQFQMTRTDSESGNMMVYFFDLHGEVDSFGSDTEYTKA